MKIILGSQSKWRKNILESMGYEFEVMVSDIDEKVVRSENLRELPLLVARAKAEALLPRIEEAAILITSDQVLIYNGDLREKPRDENEARKFLESYGLHPAESVTAVIVINTKTGKRVEGIDIAKAHFKKIPKTVIDEFVATGIPLHCAGGFTVRHELIGPYIDRIEGTYESIEGLPQELTRKLIEEVSG
jgi:septum formation protein